MIKRSRQGGRVLSRRGEKVQTCVICGGVGRWRRVTEEAEEEREREKGDDSGREERQGERVVLG